MRKYIKIFLLIFTPFVLFGQIEEHDIDIIKEMAQEEQEIIEALVLYPKEIRELIFEASTNPETIIKLGNVQSRTSEQFKELLMKYPEDVQKGVWEMTRYPQLIEKLVANPEKSEAIIKKYPEQIRDNSKIMVAEQFILLKEVVHLQKLSQSTFDRIIDPLPEKNQTVFKELIEYPEILDLLNQNIELTILGGDFYKKDPDLVRHHADSLNLVVARQQAEELEEWKYQLENDPEAMAELKEATAEFAEEYDYDGSNLTEEKEVIDDLYYDDEEYDYEADEEKYREVVHHYYHYPYWFGYPYWHVYPHWRPYPFWYEWGYCWSPYGSIMIYHMPSPFFMHWYFYAPYHHYRYVHLSNHFINHYYGHRSSGSSIVGGVKTWRTTNRGVVKENWMADEKKRIPALKEFGRMEDARTTYNVKHPGKVISKEDYVKKHQKKYSNLNTSIEKYDPNKVYPNERKDPQKTLKRDADYRTNPPKKDTRTTPQKPVRKERKIVKYKKAQDYHRQTWQKSKTRTPTRKSPTVAPQRSTPKSKSKSQSPRGRKN